METLELAIVDVETTGMSAAYDRIIEIGVLRISRGRIVSEFATLIDPERSISSRISHLTGITNESVRGAPVFRDIKCELFTLLDGAVFVAHNARFDYGFLQKEFEREGMDFSANCLCTARLSRALFPEHRRHNLDSIIERFGIHCENRHRAFDDARVLWVFLGAVKESLGTEQMRAAFARLLKTPALPAHLTRRDIQGLPDGPGVYVFYDPAGKPLYVGKSTNVRSAVTSHFDGRQRSAKTSTLSEQAADVTAESACGPLGILLREAELIKRLSPPLNRRRPSREGPIFLERVEDRLGYFTVAEHAGPVTAADVPQVAGVFLSRRELKKALRSAVEKSGLCPRRLELGKRIATPCGHAECGRCATPCPYLGSPADHNLRFVDAFARFQLKPWPFALPVTIEETGRTRTEGEVFVAHNWCLIAWFRYAEFGTECLHAEEPLFDYDRYRILAGCIDSRPRRIKEISFRAMDELLACHGVGLS